LDQFVERDRMVEGFDHVIRHGCRLWSRTVRHLPGGGPVPGLRQGHGAVARTTRPPSRIRRSRRAAPNARRHRIFRRGTSACAASHGSVRIDTLRRCGSVRDQHAMVATIRPTVTARAPSRRT